MPPSTSDTLAYLNRSRHRFLADLQEFVRFASVSAQPHHAGDVAMCAAWLANHLREIGLTSIRFLVEVGLRATRRPRPAAASVDYRGRASVGAAR